MAIPPHADLTDGRSLDRQWIAAATIPNAKMNHAIRFFRKERDERHGFDCAFDFATHRNSGAVRVPRRKARREHHWAKWAESPTADECGECTMPVANGSSRCECCLERETSAAVRKATNARNSKLHVQRRMGNLSGDCDESAQEASRYPPCARWSSARSGDYRGMPVFEPQFTPIEFAAGKDRCNPGLGIATAPSRHDELIADLGTAHLHGGSRGRVLSSGDASYPDRLALLPWLIRHREMGLPLLLHQRLEQGRPVRVGLIGAGKFGSMVLAQARRVEGLHVVGVVDSDVERSRQSLHRVGWEASRYEAASLVEALDAGTTHVSDDASALAAFDGIECIIEATGDPLAGVRHALQAIDGGKHVVMVNVEADVLCGPALAARARRAGVVYSLAYGDQPAEICELVDWVRSCGFELVAAGKGMKFEPRYRYSTPDTVWEYYGFSEEEVATGDFNPKMFNSFTDGTKSAIEMAAVANATGLDCPDDGLAFHPSGVHDLASVFKPAAEGGQLPRTGLVEIAASREPDGREVVGNLRFGMFVTFRARDSYTRDCFRQYGLLTDESGWFASMWRPFHLIGLETSVSVLSAVLRREPTGAPTEYRGEATATAKRDLKAGETLDGEGGYTVWAKAIPAARAHALDALPIGLAHNVSLRNPVPRDQVVRLRDVDLPDIPEILDLRREQREMMGGTGTQTGGMD